MCYMHILQVCHPKRGVKTTLPHKRGCPSAKDTITAIIKAIAPPHYPPPLPPDVLVSCSNNPAILEQLQCPICLEILYQPLELPCRALVCTTCLVRWFEAFSCCDVKCPCCFTDSLLLPSGLRPAPSIFMALLNTLIIQCASCKRDMQRDDYNTHNCSVMPTKNEVKIASQVINHLADTSPDKTISITTDGTVKYKAFIYIHW